MSELPASIKRADDDIERMVSRFDSQCKITPTNLEESAESEASLINDALAKSQDDKGALFEPEVIQQLQAMRKNNLAEWMRTRDKAKVAGVPVAELDKATLVQGNTGGKEMFVEVEPWHTPVVGSDLLNEIVATLKRHVIADDFTHHAAALWVVHTWCMDAFNVSPIANITAPEKRCGKTVLLTAIGKLCYRPMQVANIAPAALFRSIEAWGPTLLIDEVDSFLVEYEEARGIINSGFNRDGAFAVRCVGDNHEPTKFSTWAAKALCGIGKIADTLEDRSITLLLRRKRADETVSNIRHSDKQHWAELRSKIARFTDDNKRKISLARPSTISGLHDRANDCWEPLLVIADIADGDWPRLARTAALEIHGTAEPTQSTNTELLADIREVFERKTVSRLFTNDLLIELTSDNETPWATWNRGKPMAARQLSKRLADFGIKPSTRRVGSDVKKGYDLEQFTEAFDRYLPTTPDLSVTPLQPNNGAGFSEILSVTTLDSVADKKTQRVNDYTGCNDVTDKNPLPRDGQAEAAEYQRAKNGH